MKKNTHYTPKIEELHIGFEFQYHKKNDNKGWIDAVWGKEPYTNTKYLEETLKHQQAYELRVKHLDSEDIESQDFVIQHSMWDRESLKRTVIKYVPHPKFGSGFRFEKVINETLVWIVMWNSETGYIDIAKAHNERKRRLMWSEPKDKKEKTPTTYFMEFDELFKGIIKNKSEFKRILKQVGIVK